MIPFCCVKGAWRDVASRTSAFSALNPGSRQRAQEAAWHLLALAKLQMFQKAWELLPDVAQVDDPGLLGEGETFELCIMRKHQLGRWF